jgi:hypothetical protein
MFWLIFHGFKKCASISFTIARICFKRSLKPITSSSAVSLLRISSLLPPTVKENASSTSMMMMMMAENARRNVRDDSIIALACARNDDDGRASTADGLATLAFSLWLELLSRILTASEPQSHGCVENIILTHARLEPRYPFIFWNSLARNMDFSKYVLGSNAQRNDITGSYGNHGPTRFSKTSEKFELNCRLGSKQMVCPLQCPSLLFACSPWVGPSNNYPHTRLEQSSSAFRPAPIEPFLWPPLKRESATLRPRGRSSGTHSPILALANVQPDQDEPMRTMFSPPWACISGCGSCCYLAPAERDLDCMSEPDKELYISMAGKDGESSLLQSSWKLALFRAPEKHLSSTIFD